MHCGVFTVYYVSNVQYIVSLHALLPFWARAAFPQIIAATWLGAKQLAIGTLWFWEMHPAPQVLQKRFLYQ